MNHTFDNDNYYDSEVEYNVILKSGNLMKCVTYKTLKKLFDDLYYDKDLIFNTDDKKQKVRDDLNKCFIYKLNGIEIIQVDLSKNKNVKKCTCPPGFRGEGAFCQVHRD
jgi:hypothetical protein